MKSQQICYLLLETAENQDPFHTSDRYESFQVDQSVTQTQELKHKLCIILQSLQQEKNEFMTLHQKQQQSLIEKIHVEKDQIIEDLLKSIYNLKKQNQQLKFQYRKRFKVIKNMEQKYENLIQAKNKKITQAESIVKYLQGKLKYLQKKLSKYEAQAKKEYSNKNRLYCSKSPQNYSNKISVIISKEKNQFNPKCMITSQNSLEDLTMPLRSSFVSASKVSSSSKTLTRKKSKQRFLNSDDDQRQSDLYSSFMNLTEQNFNERNMEISTNYDDASRIRPVCLDRTPSPTSKYLRLEDFNDFDKNQYPTVQRSIRRSHQMNASYVRKRQSLLP